MLAGLNIKYSQYRGGYIEDIHYNNIIMGNQSKAALTVNSNYGESVLGSWVGAWRPLPTFPCSSARPAWCDPNILVLTRHAGAGSKNPSCPGNKKAVPCPVNTITYTNITSAPGTTVKAWIDFEGLPTNTIEGISIHGVKLNGEKSPGKSTTCKLVKGTYSDCAACASCEGLTPAA